MEAFIQGFFIFNDSSTKHFLLQVVFSFFCDVICSSFLIDGQCLCNSSMWGWGLVNCQALGHFWLFYLTQIGLAQGALVLTVSQLALLVVYIQVMACAIASMRLCRSNCALAAFKFSIAFLCCLVILDVDLIFNFFFSLWSRFAVFTGWSALLALIFTTLVNMVALVFFWTLLRIWQYNTPKIWWRSCSVALFLINCRPWVQSIDHTACQQVEFLTTNLPMISHSGQTLMIFLTNVCKSPVNWSSVSFCLQCHQ